jgi:hypothetical protein
MKKITKILIFIAIIMMAISINAQNNCGVVCHNGKLLAGVNDRAVERHINHGDTFITTDCDYVETGDECAVLSLKKINFTIPIPTGLEYTLSDINGKIRKRGETDDRLFSSFPKHEFLSLEIDGYQPLIFYKY